MSRLRNALKSIEWPQVEPSEAAVRESVQDTMEKASASDSPAVDATLGVTQVIEPPPDTPSIVDSPSGARPSVDSPSATPPEAEPVIPSSADESAAIPVEALPSLEMLDEIDQALSTTGDSTAATTPSSAVTPYLTKANEPEAVPVAELVSSAPRMSTPPGLKLRTTEPWLSEYAAAARVLSDKFARQTSTSVLFTSPEGSDGRTSLVAHLAAHLAGDGRGEVLAIDASFDRPGLALALGVRTDRGLADVASGWCHVADAIVQTGIRGLSVMGCGTLARRGAASMAELEMGPVLDQLKPSFRWILLDGSLARHAATATLARAADAVYLVARMGHTDRRAMRRAVAGLRKPGIELAGCMANGIAG